MRKSKILVSAISLMAIAPTIPITLTSCNKNDNSFTPVINRDSNIASTTCSKTELNTAFSVTCTCTDGYEVDSSTTSVNIGNKKLTFDVDYIIYKDVIIVGSSAVTDKNVNINITTKPVATHFTVSLYANNGTFNGGSTSLIINDVQKDTALKDVAGYKEPTSTDGSFAYWLDANGNKYTKDSKITTNIMLGAYYEEQPVAPTNLQTDNWATVAATCKTAVDFVKGYVNTSYSGTEEDAITLLKTEIDKFAKNTSGCIDLSKQMKINLGGRYVVVTVRLIDVGQDKAFDETNTKTLFTWEFKDIIDVCSYNCEGNSIWYQEDSETGEVLHSCLLREVCNNILCKEVLPLSVQKKIVPVAKETKTEIGGAIVKSKEEVFPLSYGEIGLQSANAIVNDLRSQGQYQYYYSLAGQENQKVVTKYYLGYDGTKEYSKDYKPVITHQMWLRSPHNESTIYKYNPDNGKIGNIYSNNGLGVAPAFCF